MSHTPTPWVHDGRYIRGPDNKLIADCWPETALGLGRPTDDISLDNVEFIVEACNNHDRLLLEKRRLRFRLESLVAQTVEFDEDEPINGADLIEWFAEERTKLINLLNEIPLE